MELRYGKSLGEIRERRDGREKGKTGSFNGDIEVWSDKVNAGKFYVVLGEFVGCYVLLFLFVFSLLVVLVCFV